MTSPATITPLSKASASRMAAALFSAPLASCTAAPSSSLFSSAPPGILQAVSFRLDSAVSASRSVFLSGHGNLVLQGGSGGSERILALSSGHPAFSCSLSAAFGGVNSRSNFGGSGSAFVGRRADMATTANASSASAPASANNIYDFTVKDIDGKDVSLSKFKGKVLLVVNVASACGLTSGNYTELAEVYSELKDSGLEILAFPCNQFGNQESGSNAKIKEFACTRYKAEYPIFDKIDVNGPNTAPVYQFLKSKKGGGILGDSIKWNFGKFLVDKQGNVVERYAPTTSPKKIMGDIKKFLGR